MLNRGQTIVCFDYHLVFYTTYLIPGRHYPVTFFSEWSDLPTVVSIADFSLAFIGGSSWQDE